MDTTWWRSFGDPELTSLVDRLAAQNLDLKITAEAVQQARATRRIATSQGLPHLNGMGTYDRIRPSKNGLLTLVEPSARGMAMPEFNQYDIGGDASWEIDLFGRVRRQVEAADAGTQAAIEDRRGVALAAIAELATDYMQLRSVQSQIQLLRNTVASLTHRARLVQDQFATGRVSEVDVAEADAELARVAQNLPALQTQESRLENAIALLLAAQPRSLNAELSDRPGMQPLVPPAVPIGMPSDLARRRPDVRRSEALLHAATAEIGVAVADFFPKVTLNGSASFNSLTAGSLFTWMSRMFIAGGTVSLPIFQGGKLTGQLEFTRAGQREAVLSYQKTVLTALHEVDDALTAYADAQHMRADALTTEVADKRILRLALDRYAAGAVDYLTVIAAEDQLFQAQSQVAQANGRVETTLVDLYKALGGGWEGIPDPEKPSARDGELHLHE